jgi:predicted naringenin-chalcone synthase
MSSPTLLFVLKELMRQETQGPVFAAAFGPGLTMETFTAAYA